MSRDLFTTPIPTKEDLEKKNPITSQGLEVYCKSLRSNGECERCILFDESEGGCKKSRIYLD